MAIRVQHGPSLALAGKVAFESGRQGRAGEILARIAEQNRQRDFQLQRDQIAFDQQAALNQQRFEQSIGLQDRRFQQNLGLNEQRFSLGQMEADFAQQRGIDNFVFEQEYQNFNKNIRNRIRDPQDGDAWSEVIGQRKKIETWARNERPPQDQVQSAYAQWRNSALDAMNEIGGRVASQGELPGDVITVDGVARVGIGEDGVSRTLMGPADGVSAADFQQWLDNNTYKVRAGDKEKVMLYGQELAEGTVKEESTGSMPIDAKTFFTLQKQVEDEHRATHDARAQSEGENYRPKQYEPLTASERAGAVRDLVEAYQMINDRPLQSAGDFFGTTVDSLVNRQQASAQPVKTDIAVEDAPTVVEAPEIPSTPESQAPILTFDGSAPEFERVNEPKFSGFDSPSAGLVPVADDTAGKIALQEAGYTSADVTQAITDFTVLLQQYGSRDEMPEVEKDLFDKSEEILNIAGARTSTPGESGQDRALRAKGYSREDIAEAEAIIRRYGPLYDRRADMPPQIGELYDSALQALETAAGLQGKNPFKIEGSPQQLLSAAQKAIAKEDAISELSRRGFDEFEVNHYLNLLQSLAERFPNGKLSEEWKRNLEPYEGLQKVLKNL